MRPFTNEKGEPLKPNYTKLKVYKAALDAHKSIQTGPGPSGKGMANEVKFTDAAKAKSDIRTIIRLIAKADETRDRKHRAAIQYEALYLIPDIYINLRTLLDLQYLTEKRWSQTVLRLESTRQQLEAWYNYTLKETGTSPTGKNGDNTYDLLYDIPEPPEYRNESGTAL